MGDQATRGDSSAFRLLQNGHRDMVSATAFNMYGNRFGTGSVDGTIKIHNKHKDGSWSLCDTWNAHSSEIHQIQWLPVAIYPNLIASLAADGKFKIWAEDPTIPPGKGKRFNSWGNQTVFELFSVSRSPYISFSITHNSLSRHTFIAIINRSGTVFIYENDEPESLDSWHEIDSFVVCEKPARGEEISFKIAFDPNLNPTYTAILQGVPKNALGLVVASMYTASVWRTREITQGVSLGGTNTKEFYRAVELKGHKGLVRDIAWAPGNIRGHDVIATVCKDGFLRIFQVWTPPKNMQKNEEMVVNKEDAQIPIKDPLPSQSAEAGTKSTSSSPGSEPVEMLAKLEEKEKNDKVVHIAKEVALLNMDESRLPPWKVEFDADGTLLGSTSDDGKVCLWKRDINGNWAKYSELVIAKDEIS